MRYVILAIMLAVVSFSGKAQLPAGAYGPYTFVANYDKNGEELNVRGFEKITLNVMTTNFFGITQSSLFYSYDFGGYQVSGSFEYSGMSDGWYVYSFYGMFVYVSQNRKKVLVTNPYGGLSEYYKY